ncbi:MAG: hypothetical protein GY874_15880 [Desulfobacteraceae bacterium]|nr:hypothetical protein [Desulfobacteraceae bacterium]
MYQYSNSWPDALKKQAVFTENEALLHASADGDEISSYYGDSRDACNRALEIWEEIEGANESQIAELEEKLKSIRDEIRLKVAQKLLAESNQSGWRDIAIAIEKNYEISSFLNLW